MNTIGLRRTSIVIIAALTVFFAVGFTNRLADARPTPASASNGVISGRVTADQGDVRAFRVRAKDTVHLISYTVFTNKGQYHVYNLPPSTYEVQVREPGFDSPVQVVELGSGDTKSADLALKEKPPAKSNVKLVEYDELYPPGPARDILENNCFGCHGYQEGGLSPYHLMAGRTEGEWAAALVKMFWVPGVFPSPTWPSPSASTSLGYNDPGWLTGEQRLLVIKYLAANFGPNHERRDIKLETFVRDEDALAQAVYTQYELPAVDQSQSPGLSLARGTHDVMPSPDPARRGTVWMAENAASSILRVDTQNLDPKTRNTEWTVHDSRGNFNVGPTAITERNGHVYWTEVMDDNVGDLDIASGQIRRYLAPTIGLAMHGIGVDSRGNIWTAGQPGTIDRLNIETKEFTEWRPSEGLGNYYTLKVDKKDRVWAVSTARQILSMWDPKTEKWITLKPPHNVRRIVFDSKGMVWLCEYHANSFVMLDPDTGKFTEYKLPLKYGNPYEIAADRNDNIWLENAAYESFVRFDRQTKKFTYFPYPEIRTHTPKVEFDTEGTMWSDLNAGVREPRLTAFKPYGNVPTKNGNTLAGKN
jgi:streptogramin lyase